MCRICFSTETSEARPLISLCKCMGSMKFVHYSCLKLWLAQKMVASQASQLHAYTWKAFECEICKTPYPCMYPTQGVVSIRHRGTKYNIMDITLPTTGDFLLLETINKDKTSARSVHVIMPHPEKLKFKIGRGHESDARIADISVSRFHAQITCTPNGFIVEDNRSKFGTLVLEPSPLLLELDQTKAVQVGRTLIHLTMRRVPLELPVPAGTSGSLAPLQPCSGTGAAGSPGKPSVGGAGSNNDDGSQMDEIPDESNN